MTVTFVNNPTNQALEKERERLTDIFNSLKGRGGKKKISKSVSHTIANELKA